MKKLKLFVIMLLIISLAGCVTCDESSFTLPDDLEIPNITGDDNRDIIGLVIQDVRWRLLTAEMRWIVGVLDDEEYEARSNELLAILEGVKYGDN